MTTLQPRYSKEEFARRGQEIYERAIQPHVSASDEGKFVAVDIETGMYAMDADDYTATEQLLRRNPDAQIWLVRVGHRAAYRSVGKETNSMKFTRITVNPRQMSGVPCLRGLRIPVATIVGMVAEGMSESEILQAFPDLEREDIREALCFAAEAVRERTLPLAPDA